MPDGAPVLNPLTEFPVGGGLVALLDEFLLDIGLTPWVSELMEFFVLMILLFAGLSAVVGRLVPWLSSKLLERPGLVAAPVPAILLAPEWVVTKTLVAMGRAPGGVVYGYGDGVLVVADGVQVVVTAVLRGLSRLGGARKLIASLLLALGFLWWNSDTCVGGLTPCVSPVQHWVQQVEEE